MVSKRVSVKDARDVLPLTPRVFLILWGLSREPQHGYALLRTVEELARGRVRVGPTSLYEAIHTLKQRRLIEETDAPPDADARRRYLRLTGLGREVFLAEADRLDGLVADLRTSGVLGGDAQGT